MREILQTALAYAVGLVVPGYLLARGLGSRAAWALAVPLSMGILLAGVQLLDAAGLPLRLGYAVAWELAAIALLAWAGWALRPARAPGRPSPPAEPGVPVTVTSGAAGASTWLVAAGVALVGTLAIVRGLLAPLTGGDVSFRWEFLALQMLRHGSIAFYPPVTAADFRIYAYPDGLAPLVSSSVWWLYGALGRADPVAAAPLAILQYGAALGLSWAIARRLGSPRAALLACAALAATPLFFRGVMIGQETGLTALAVLGMVWALVERDAVDWRAAVLAGALAGVGANAREYGFTLMGCGLLVLGWRRAGWRALGLFVATWLAVSAPWMIRNVARCGNPVYALALGVFPVNPTFGALVEHWRAAFGLQRYGPDFWWALAELFLLEAGTLLVGLPAALLLARRHGYLLGGAALVLVLWLASIPYTAGGVPWSMRVLTPALALLAVATGLAVGRWEGNGRRWRRAASGAVALALLVHAAAWAAVFPDQPALHAWRWPGRHFFMQVRLPVPEAGLDESLKGVLPPGTRILGDDVRAHAVFVNAGSSYELVPLWSPEVAFLFDPGLAATAQRARLQDLGITAVLHAPDDVNAAVWLARSPFYRDELPRWTPVALGGTDLLQWVLVPRRP